MQATHSQTGKPQITDKGIVIAVAGWMFYTLLSTILLSYSDNVPFLGALIGMSLSSFIMALLMVPPWIIIVRNMYKQSGWIKWVAHLIAGIIYTFAWYYLYLFVFDWLFGIERLGDRLSVQLEVDENVLDLSIPPMILQPLVENAVKHGIAPLEEGGHIIIQIKEQGENVRFVIKDTGRGMPPEYTNSNDGIGLHNINEMLCKRFGKSHGLDVSPNQPKGTNVSFSIPIN